MIKFNKTNLYKLNKEWIQTLPEHEKEYFLPISQLVKDDMEYKSFEGMLEEYNSIYNIKSFDYFFHNWYKKQSFNCKLKKVLK